MEQNVQNVENESKAEEFIVEKKKGFGARTWEATKKHWKWVVVGIGVVVTVAGYFINEMSKNDGEEVTVETDVQVDVETPAE